MTNFDEFSPAEMFKSLDRRVDLQDRSLLSSIPSSSRAMTLLRDALRRLGDSADSSEQARNLAKSVLSNKVPLSALLNETVFPHAPNQEAGSEIQDSPKEKGIRWV